MSDDPEDLVDVFYRPYVRALGNLVITFAQAEAALLSMVTEFLDGDELAAVALLKKADTAKDEVAKLVRAEDLPLEEAKELFAGIDAFWLDRDLRHRLIHDEWFPNMLHELGGIGSALTRGITRKKPVEVVYSEPSVNEVWALAARFREWQLLFSFHQYSKSRRKDEDNTH